VTVTEFLLARIAEDEATARAAGVTGHSWGTMIEETGSGENIYYTVEVPGVKDSTIADMWSTDQIGRDQSEHIARHDPARVLAECAAKRAIIKQHEDWPVLVEGELEMEPASSDIQSMAYRATRQIAWMTEQEYIKRFGVEPPTAPMVATLAAVYADHPEYRQEWQ
jgi:hypothetical protein